MKFNFLISLAAASSSIGPDAATTVGSSSAPPVTPVATITIEKVYGRLSNTPKAPGFWGAEDKFGKIVFNSMLETDWIAKEAILSGEERKPGVLVRFIKTPPEGVSIDFPVSWKTNFDLKRDSECAEKIFPDGYVLNPLHMIAGDSVDKNSIVMPPKVRDEADFGFMKQASNIVGHDWSTNLDTKIQDNWKVSVYAINEHKPLWAPLRYMTDRKASAAKVGLALIEAMQMIHKKHNIAHQYLTPDTVYFAKDPNGKIDIVLTHFDFAVDIADDDSIVRSHDFAQIAKIVLWLHTNDWIEDELKEGDRRFGSPPELNDFCTNIIKNDLHKATTFLQKLSPSSLRSPSVSGDPAPIDPNGHFQQGTWFKITRVEVSVIAVKSDEAPKA